VRARRSARTLAFVAVLCTAVGVGIVSLERTGNQLAVLEACERARVGDYRGALELSEGRVGADETGRAAAECRCAALVALGRSDECLALLETLLADPASETWAPEPALATRLIERWRVAGRAADAAALARRAGRAHPLDAGLFHLELAMRASTEDEEALLRELEGRIPERGDAATRMRVSLAQRRLQRSEVPRALAVLGAGPAPDSVTSLGLWFDTRGIAHAMAGDVSATRDSFDAWQRAGGDPNEVRARYAIALSIAGLADPQRSTIDLLRDALAATAALDDPALRETLAIRLILTLSNADRLDEALALYDRHREELGLEGLQREELERALRTQALAGLTRAERRGSLRFRLVGAPAASELWLTPEPDALPDSEYQRIALSASGTASVERSAGDAPQRWVLRSDRGVPLASGAVGPIPGATVEIEVRPGAAPPPVAPVALSRRAADGRRRISLVVLDCADWRIAQYLRTRGELPVLDALLASGHRAVLDSNPPLTAAALESLVWPQRRGDASFAGLLHQLGTEVAGLASVGENPVEWLTWILPESEDLFSAVGAGERSAVNLLLSHGGIRAGRHGEVTGPAGVRRRLALGSTARDLDADERARWPELAALENPRDALYVRTIAAELDVATELARGSAIDLVAIRIEPLDILTHAHFGEINLDGQDDGVGLLFSVYRYIDARLASLHNALDADDVLIVMSDHGIRTAMEHSRDAIFVAVGAGIPHGRSPGRPALRGVSRAVADLLAVSTDWPKTGVAPWARAFAAGALRTADAQAR
jgi:hypothetical protein